MPADICGGTLKFAASLFVDSNSDNEWIIGITQYYLSHTSPVSPLVPISASLNGIAREKLLRSPARVLLDPVGWAYTNRDSRLVLANVK